ncbi:SpaA isopeptide-forming pilin-related protein [Fannyhessea vaginae]|uniref:SpaA isopeptide-forming pilin-related protein n=1 Tax=Fannyhessea vaginae TaxID=82135 RepID=UPI0023EFDB17|nr:SpaA isopeptide-forming pilin-related protein [Fannyhessea vaginae]
MQLFERLKTHVKRASFTLSERIHKHVRALCKFKESKGFKHQCQLFGGAALACGLVAATLLNPLFSHAQTINLAGGGTIELHSDGTITGICYSELDLSAVRAGRHAEFYITMPDGSTLRTYCLNHGQAAPADGNYTFTGTPNGDGSYNITVHSSVGAKHRVSGAYPLPAQNSGGAVWSPRMTGWIAIQKASSNPDCSDHNSMYSLEGAEYDVYDTQGQVVDTITTDENGYGCSHELLPGYYKVWERTAPKGYALDTQGHAVDVLAGDTQTLNVVDTPQNDPVQISVRKQDAQTGNASPQGAATLEGAEFTLKFYPRESATGEPARTWVLKTDKNGIADIDQAGRIDPQTYFVKGDPFYKNSLGRIVMPLGTLTIEETKAPAGYLLNSHDVHTVHITSDNTSEEEVHTYVVPKHNEQVNRGDIRIEKIDKELMSNKTQGDATLEGITFAVVNLNTQAVKTSMGICDPQQVCARITTTNKDGHFIAQTSDQDLPFGHYRIYEESSNDSYLNDGFEAEFDITHDKELVSLTDANSCAKDSVVRGGIKLGKIDKELNVHSPQAAATLEGAEFSIYNKSTAPVQIDDKLVAPNELVTTLTTDETASAETDKRLLPYGTYLIQETKAPRGYELNSTWQRLVKIRKDSTMYDLSSEKESVDDQVNRGDIRLIKRDDQTQKPLSGVIFKLTSKTTGETHLLMTDENGEINTSSEFVKHSYMTNQNDSALNADGTCDATKLVMDTGVWFGGTQDTEDGAKPSDTLGALPYDTYTISELSSPQNKGKKLISFDIQLTRPHYNLILGTLNNKPAESFISELLSTNLNHSAYTEEKTTLTDTLSFENLNVGSSYTVSGYLVDKDTGEPLQDAQGKDIRVEKTFTARIASDRVKLVYTFNAKGLNGKSVVAFATLKDKDRNIICSEKDLDEPDQSVSFTNPPTPPTTPPVTPPDEPPTTPPDEPHAPLAKTSDMLQLGLGLLALGAGIGLISYGIYRKRKKRV